MIIKLALHKILLPTCIWADEPDYSAEVVGRHVSWMLWLSFF